MAVYDAVEHRSPGLALPLLVTVTIGSVIFGAWYAMNRSHILGTSPTLITIADFVRPHESLRNLIAAHQHAVATGDLTSADRIGAMMMSRTETSRYTTLAGFAMNDRALVLQALGRRDEAELLFRQVLAMGRSDAPHHQVVRMRNLAALLIEDERFEEADQLLFQIAEIAPDWMQHRR